MFKNKKFAKHGIAFMIISFFYNFFFSGLLTDHMNILTPYMIEHYGWNDLKVTNPTLIVLALACAGVTLAGENYGIYFVSLFIIRTLVVPLQMGSFMLAGNWFIKYRGRVLGLITAGSPLFSIVGIAFLTIMVSKIGLSTYLIISTMLLITAVFTFIVVKDTPEELGLFPDGSDKAPLSEEHIDIEAITLKEILTDSRAWKLIISYGILFFVIVASMGYMAIRFISLSTPEDLPNLFVSKGLIWLSVGAASGIPMSYVIGFIDDKFGSIKASLLLIVLFLFAVVPLAIMPVGGSVPLMTIQAIPTALAYPFMGILNQSGNLTLAYFIMIGLLAIAFVTVLSMKNIPDANEADRDYGVKVANVELT